jgi:phosphoribosylanthranilate isomerase
MRPAYVILSIVGTLSALWLLAKAFGGSTPRSLISNVAGVGGSASAEVVLVTVFDETTDGPIQEIVQQNRIDYAQKHGTYRFTL